MRVQKWKKMRGKHFGNIVKIVFKNQRILTNFFWKKNILKMFLKLSFYYFILFFSIFDKCRKEVLQEENPICWSSLIERQLLTTKTEYRGYCIHQRIKVY